MIVRILLKGGVDGDDTRRNEEEVGGDLNYEAVFDNIHRKLDYQEKRCKLENVTKVTLVKGNYKPLMNFPGGADTDVPQKEPTQPNTDEPSSTTTDEPSSTTTDEPSTTTTDEPSTTQPNELAEEEDDGGRERDHATRKNRKNDMESVTQTKKKKKTKARGKEDEKKKGKKKKKKKTKTKTKEDETK